IQQISLHVPVLHDNDQQQQQQELLSSNDLLERIKPSTQQQQQQINFNEDIDEKDRMQSLGRLYKDLGADINTAELEVTDLLANQLANRIKLKDENVQNILRTKLQIYFESKKTSDRTDNKPTITWDDFCDVLFPITSGRFTNKDIELWFKLFDSDNNGYLTKEQITNLIYLLQIKNPENTVDRLLLYDDNKRLSVQELIIAMNVDATSQQIITENEQDKRKQVYNTSWLRWLWSGIF
ncbi:unnamed protein product, partial [Didymodactylos carnosus]